MQLSLDEFKELAGILYGQPTTDDLKNSQNLQEKNKKINDANKAIGEILGKMILQLLNNTHTTQE